MVTMVTFWMVEKMTMKYKWCIECDDPNWYNPEKDEIPMKCRSCGHKFDM